MVTNGKKKKNTELIQFYIDQFIVVFYPCVSFNLNRNRTKLYSHSKQRKEFESFQNINFTHTKKKTMSEIKQHNEQFQIVWQTLCFIA